MSPVISAVVVSAKMEYAKPNKMSTMIIYNALGTLTAILVSSVSRKRVFHSKTSDFRVKMTSDASTQLDAHRESVSSTEH